MCACQRGGRRLFRLAENAGHLETPARGRDGMAPPTQRVAGLSGAFKHDTSPSAARGVNSLVELLIDLIRGSKFALLPSTRVSDL